MRGTVLMPLNTTLDFFTMNNVSIYVTQTRFETAPNSTASCFAISGGFSSAISCCIIRYFQTGLTITGTSFQTSTLAITDTTFAQNQRVLTGSGFSFFMDSCQIQGSLTFSAVTSFTGVYVTGLPCLSLIAGCLFSKCGVAIHGDSQAFVLVSGCNFVYCEIGIEGFSQSVINVSSSNSVKMNTNHIAYNLSDAGTILRSTACTIDGRDLNGIAAGTGYVVHNDALVSLLSCVLTSCVLGIEVGLTTDTSSTKVIVENSKFRFNTTSIKQQGTSSLQAFLISIDNPQTDFIFNSVANIKLSFSTGEGVWLRIGELDNSTQIDLLAVATKIIDFPKLSYRSSIYSSETLYYDNPDSTVNGGFANVAQLDSCVNAISRNISQKCSLRLLSDTSSIIGDGTNKRGWEIQKSSAVNAALGFFYSNDLDGQPTVSDVKKFEIDPVDNSLFLSNLNLNWTQGSNLYEIATNSLKMDGNLTIDSLTPEFVLISDSLNKLVSSNTSAIELGYLSGVTSSLQTQLNGKLNLSGGSLTGQLISNVIGSSASSPNILINGAGIYSSLSNHFDIATNNIQRFSISNSGVVSIFALNTNGIVHNNSAGLLSTSLLLNADITNSTITNSKLATVSSANNANYLVARDGSGNFVTNMISLLGNIANPTDAVTKQYVDDAISFGFQVHDPANVVSFANIILSGLQTIDSILLVDGNRVLLVGQSSPIENGPWVANSSTWTRPTDFANGDIAGASSFLILQGTTYTGAIFVCTTPMATIGTDILSFAEFSLPQSSSGVNDGIGQGSIYSSAVSNILHFRTLLQGDAYISINNLTDEVSIATNATSLNTISTLVARDLNGDFAAGTITANLTGFASENLLLSGGILLGTLKLPTGSGVTPSLQIGAVDVGFSSNSGNLQMSTNGTIRLVLSSAGILTVISLSSVGVLHSDISGNLSTSLIVGADITNATISTNKLASVSSANTPSFIVSRDINGSFSAGTITANLSGIVTGSLIGHASLDLALTGGILSGSLQCPIYYIGSTNTSLIETAGSLEFVTNAISNMSLSSSGTLRIHNLTTGLLHSGASGIITSSLIVNADITNTTITNAKLATISSSNTAGNIVVRDVSGDFAANNITANLIGYANLNLLLTGGTLSGVLVLPTGTPSACALQLGSANLGLSTAAGALQLNTAFGTGISLASTGAISLPFYTTLGIVHNSISGLLSSSLIVDADITVGTIANNKLVSLSSAGLVLNSATTATSANVVNSIVTRDASGNFICSMITGNITGNVVGHASLDLPLTGGTLSGVLVLPAGIPSACALQLGSANLGLSAATGVLQLNTAFGTGISLASTGAISLPFYTTLGIVHNSVSGLLSSSLIVDADITVGTIANNKLVTLTTPLLVSNSATTATSTNVINAIVARDGSGGIIITNMTQTTPSAITIYQITQFSQAFGSPASVATLVSATAVGGFLQRSNPNSDFTFNSTTGQITYTGTTTKWFSCQISFSIQQQAAARTVEFWIQKGGIANPNGPISFLEFALLGLTTNLSLTAPPENIQLATGNTIQLASRINQNNTSANFRNITYSLNQI